MKNEFSGVRMGRMADAEKVYQFLLNLDEENSVFDLSEQRAREAITTCLDPKRGVIGIIEKDNIMQACIGLRTSQMWYTDEWFLDELWNFVHPDFRKSNNAKNLIEFAKWSSFNLNIPLVMGIITKKRLEPKMRLYQRQMPQVGAYFVWGKNFEDMCQPRKL